MPDAAVPARPASPGDPSIDRGLLRVYLNDHLAGAVAGSQRMRRTADTLARTPMGVPMDRVATQVAEEREELRAILRSLGLTESRPKQVATWLAERVARLKVNGRVGRHSPLTTLLEVVLLRSAVLGKRGGWQVLTEHAGELGIDPARTQRLADRSEEQIRTLDQVHAYVRARALRAGSSPV